MISACLKRLRNIFKQSFRLLNMDISSYSMKHIAQVLKRRTKNFSDSLMPQTNAKHRLNGSIFANDVAHHSGLQGDAGTGGEQKLVIVIDCFDIYQIISHHINTDLGAIL